MLSINDRFSSKEDLVHAVQTFSILQVVEFETLFTDRSRYTVQCPDSDCEWRLHASVTIQGGSEFSVRKLTQHTCDGIITSVKINWSR
jgi:hypothetical protein